MNRKFFEKQGKAVAVILITSFLVGTGIAFGFAYDRYSFREECLKFAFEGVESDLSSDEVARITRLLNEKTPAVEEKPDQDTVFVGSVNSNKFYPEYCHWANRIKEENKVWFSSVEEGENDGREYIECKKP